jgi:hypothetical protein
MAELISLSELARRLGRAKSGLHKLAANGQIPKGGDGKFDEAAVREALAANTDPSRQSEPFTTVHGTENAENGERPAALAAVVAQATVEAHLATTRVREILAAEGVVIAADEPLTFNHARTAEKIVQTWERDRAHAEAAGRMIDAAVAERRWADEMVKFRARLLAIAGKVAMQLSHLTPHEVQAIDQVVRDTMTDAAGDDDDAA